MCKDNDDEKFQLQPSCNIHVHFIILFHFIVEYNANIYMYKSNTNNNTVQIGYKFFLIKSSTPIRFW